MAQETHLVVHPLEPLYDEHSRVLVLGSLPSPLSRQHSFYYANPHNRFWPVMAQVLDEELPAGNEERARMLLRHGVALWDVVARCEIAGASDASIRNPVPNDLTRILKVAPVRRIFATGATAAQLYRRLIEPVLGRPIVQLPSTSPANARWRLPQLVEAYRVIAEDLQAARCLGGCDAGVRSACAHEGGARVR